jgi:hypothetical protein
MAALFASTNLRATTVAPLSFDELVSRADRIVVGQVVSVESRAEGDVIRTHVTFRVSQAVKGRASTLVPLTFLGGQVGERGMHVAGMPQFKVGDENVLFFVERTDTVNPIVGFWHGRVRIERASGRATVVRHDRTRFSKASALTESAAPAAATSQDTGTMDLDTFLADVRRVVNSRGTGR